MTTEHLLQACPLHTRAMCLTSTETIRLIRDGEKGGREYGCGGRRSHGPLSLLYIYRSMLLFTSLPGGEEAFQQPGLTDDLQCTAAFVRRTRISIWVIDKKKAVGYKGTRSNRRGCRSFPDRMDTVLAWPGQLNGCVECCCFSFCSAGERQLQGSPRAG